jgi:glutamate synthase (NADPH/NADH) large chain
LVGFDEKDAQDERTLYELISEHGRRTGSTVAEALLADWPAALARFTRVMPSDYKRVLEAQEEALEEGLTEDEAAARIMEVLHG